MKMTGSRKWWALGALTARCLAVGLDGTVLSVAIPTLARALNAGEADLQWFSSGYLLVLAAAMLPMGLFGDRFGRKKVLLTVLVLFGAGSAACAFAPTADAFIAARFVLGLAGAGIIVMALSGLTVLFTTRGAATGSWRLGGCQLHSAPDRPDPRWLAADALLVGMGVPHERTRRSDWPDRGAGARAGVTCSCPPCTRPCRGRSFNRGLGWPNIRLH